MWSDDVRKKISDLELIASWASQVNLGTVRDSIRKATSELRRELESPRCMEESMLAAGLTTMPLDIAEQFERDPERVRRKELAEYALRAHGDL